ncbi:MAG: ABC transporter permease, partial [Candidatus Dadabacteria bacterium]
PLTHLVLLARDWSLGRLHPGQWASLAYLAAFAGLAFLLALRRMRRRLIR